MRSIYYNVYKVDDGFIGKANETAKHLNTTVTNMLNLLWRNKNIEGHKVEVLYNYKPIYGAFEDNRLIIKGSYKDIADKLFLSPSTIRNAKNTKRKVLGLYEIKEIVNEK